MYLKNDRILIASIIMVDVAFYAGHAGVVGGASIASRNGMVRRGIEPILQALTRHGLLESVRGPGGGYRVGRNSQGATLRDVARALGVEDEPSLRHGEPYSSLYALVLGPLWARMNESVAHELAKITIAELITQADKKGLKRPVWGALPFSI